MLTLEFKDELVTNKFSSGNRYNYAPKEQLNFRINKESPEEPFIMRATLNGQRVHIGDHISYSTNDNQLQNRMISGLKLQEILDSSRMPILVRQADKQYLVGKGFLAAVMPRKRVKLLFVACVPKEARVTNMSQVKLYISRDLYSDEHKRVAQIIKSIMNTHRGDVVISRDIMSYLGRSLSIAALPSLREKKEAINEIFNATVKRVRSAS
jgi:hypothetical protein